jgi:mannose-1-phosphate guanylyltransferase/phosphomannomutase
VDKNGRVIKFIEKPRPEEMVSDLVNTGIYILERDILKYIPDNEFFDFGNDLFPIALENGEKIFGILVKGKLIAVDTPELLNMCQSVN